MSQNLDRAFKQIQKNSEALAMNAMMSAANEALKLAKEEANNCLTNYLSRTPRIYKRLNPSPLSKALTAKEPEMTQNGDNYTISFSLTYDSSIIKGAYKSYSKRHQSGDTWISRNYDEDKFHKDQSDNGIPDSGWILQNYLEGKHGWVDDKGRKPDFMMGWQDAEKPGEVMKNFFEKELPEQAGKLIYKAMQGAIVDFLKMNGGGK